MENEGTDGSVITSLLLDEKNKFFSDGYEVSLICDGYDIPINRDKAKKIIRWLQKEFNLGCK